MIGSSPANISRLDALGTQLQLGDEVLFAEYIGSYYRKYRKAAMTKGVITQGTVEGWVTVAHLANKSIAEDIKSRDCVLIKRKNGSTRLRG